MRYYFINMHTKWVDIPKRLLNSKGKKKNSADDIDKTSLWYAFISFYWTAQRTAHSTINTRNDQMFKHFIDLQSKYGKTTVEWIWMDYRIFRCLWVSALILNIISIDTGRTCMWENSFSCQNMCSIQHHPMMYTVHCRLHSTPDDLKFWLHDIHYSQYIQNPSSSHQFY